MIGDRMLKKFARKLVERLRSVAGYYKTNRDRPDSETIAAVLAVLALVIEQVAEIEGPEGPEEN